MQQNLKKQVLVDANFFLGTFLEFIARDDLGNHFISLL